MRVLAIVRVVPRRRHHDSVPLVQAPSSTLKTCRRRRSRRRWRREPNGDRLGVPAPVGAGGDGDRGIASRARARRVGWDADRCFGAVAAPVGRCCGSLRRAAALVATRTRPAGRRRQRCDAMSSRRNTTASRRGGIGAEARALRIQHQHTPVSTDVRAHLSAFRWRGGPAAAAARGSLGGWPSPFSPPSPRAWNRCSPASCAAWGREHRQAGPRRRVVPAARSRPRTASACGRAWPAASCCR